MITVRGRELIIPESERQIGTQYDSNSEVRQIKVSRLTAGGVDISHLDFRLDLRYGNEKKDTALLDKEISDEDIILTWTVGPNSVKEVGTVWIAVRGSDDFGKVKWATNQGYLYVGKTIDTPSGEGVDLTEMEELEKRLDQKTAELDTAEKKRVEAENIREENEQQRLNNEREWQIQGEKAVQAAKDAQAAASAAEKEKTVAMEYATAAGGSADDARQYAESASTSAVNADASAKRAEEIAEGLGSYDGTAASVTAVDTHNFTGTGAGKKSTVQALLDKIAQKLIEKVVTSDTFQTVLAKYLVNNGLTTEAGKFGLDAAFGKNLQDQITEQNSNINQIGQVLTAGSPTAYVTEQGKSYDICSLTLSDGKWIVIGATLSPGNLKIDGAQTAISRKTVHNDDTNLIISMATGPNKITLKLTEVYQPGMIHADANYCYLRAIRIG